MSVIRRLELEDFEKGFLDLLRQLRPMEKNIDNDLFRKLFDQINLSTTHIFVIEKKSLIVATATLVCMPKFIYAGKCLGQIEDVVVHRRFRKEGIGSSILNFCIKFAKEQLKCHKVALCARPSANSFYLKNGFKVIGEYFAMYNEVADENEDPSRGSISPSKQINCGTLDKIPGVCHRTTKNYFD